jgi:hypothetical protein
MSDSHEPNVEKPLSKLELERSLEFFSTVTKGFPAYEAKLVAHDVHGTVEVEADGRGNVTGDRTDFKGKVLTAVRRVDSLSNPEPQHIDKFL